MQQFKKLLLILLFCFLTGSLFAGTNPSKHKYGVILGPLTTTQREALGVASDGLLVYDSDLNNFYGVINGAWSVLGGAAASSTTTLATYTLEFADSDLSTDAYTLASSNVYTSAASNTILFRNGLAEKIDIDYTETSTTVITKIDYTANSSDLYTFRQVASGSTNFRQYFGNSDLAADVYTITGGEGYVSASQAMLVWRNGFLLRVGTDYDETSTSTITITNHTADASDSYILHNFTSTANAFQQDFTNASLTADVYTITGGNGYVTGAKQLHVFRNGLTLRVDTDYTETSSSTFTMIDYTADASDTYTVKRY